MKRSASTLRVLLPVLLVDIFVASCTTNDLSAAAQTSKGHKTVARGTLVGRVTRGPVCAVQTAERPCPPEPAPGVQLVISPLGGEGTNSVQTDDEGAYRISLPPGTYRIEMSAPGSMEFTKDLPTTVTVTEGQETHRNISLDTGIR